MRGAFVVIEGLDRSGKSTQAALLEKWLQDEGYKVKLIKFPDRTTPIGRIIDQYLRSSSDLDDRAIHLLFSANRWEAASSIQADLKEGSHILCDRYAFSGIAFSAAKGLSYEWCRAPDVGLPAPDVTLFFDVSPEVARTRGGWGEERYEKEEMQRQVRLVFDRIAGEMQGHWLRVDADTSVSKVQNAAQAAVREVLQRDRESLGKLWADA